MRKTDDCPNTDVVGVRFEQPEGLNRFCQAVRQHGLSYSLAGSNTVILSTTALKELQKEHVGVLKDYPHRVNSVSYFSQLGSEAQQRVVKRRLLSKVRVLQNIRARLTKHR